MPKTVDDAAIVLRPFERRVADAQLVLHEKSDLRWKPSIEGPRSSRESRRRQPSDDSNAWDNWRQAVALFDQALEDAYAADFWAHWLLMKAGDEAGLETGIAFLEDDPWFFRSGYVKESLIRFVNKFDLTSLQKERLQNAVLKVVDRRDGREFRRYCRLARKVYSAELKARLEERLGHENPNVRRRARWVLEACQTL